MSQSIDSTRILKIRLESRLSRLKPTLSRLKISKKIDLKSTGSRLKLKNSLIFYLKWFPAMSSRFDLDDCFTPREFGLLRARGEPAIDCESNKGTSN